MTTELRDDAHDAPVVGAFARARVWRRGGHVRDFTWAWVCTDCAASTWTFDPDEEIVLCFGYASTHEEAIDEACRHLRAHHAGPTA